MADTIPKSTTRKGIEPVPYGKFNEYQQRIYESAVGERYTRTYSSYSQTTTSANNSQTGTRTFTTNGDTTRHPHISSAEADRHASRTASTNNNYVTGGPYASFNRQQKAIYENARAERIERGSRTYSTDSNRSTYPDRASDSDIERSPVPVPVPPNNRTIPDQQQTTSSEIAFTHEISNEQPYTNQTTRSNYSNNVQNVGRDIRSARLKNGIERTNRYSRQTSADSKWTVGEEFDWRVKISVPQVDPFSGSAILTPLRETDDAMVFPYTPNVIITHNANYNALSPTHNNYTYPAYQNSSIEQITITGEFSVENEEEANYWVAANHFLRSITKMFYGESSNKGAPPPIVRLNGYGDFVFNNVPVIVESFMMNLPKDVDYIRADIGENGAWVPVLSELSVTVRTAYSRGKVNKFSLNDFVNGTYLSSDGPGFI